MFTISNGVFVRSCFSHSLGRKKKSILMCLCVYLYQVKQIWASPTGRRGMEGRWPPVHQTCETECS